MYLGITCGRPTQAQNGTVWPIKETYPIGSRVDYQCNTTDKDNKNQLESRTCRQNGAWSKIEQSNNNTTSKCVLKGTYGCPDPDAPSHGVVHFTSIRDTIPKAEFVCNDGYRLSTTGAYFRAACYFITGQPVCQRNSIKHFNYLTYKSNILKKK